MNVAENLLLQQMQQMAAGFSLPETGGGKKEGASFQDMMEQVGKEAGAVEKETPETGSQSETEAAQDSPEENAPVQESKEDQEAGKLQELHGDPNAMAYVMDLFRPEIVEVAEVETTQAAPVEAPVEALAEAAEEVVPAAGTPEGAAPQTQQPVETVEKPAEEAAPQDLSQNPPQDLPQEEVVQQAEKPAPEAAEAPQRQVERETTAQQEDAPAVQGQPEKPAKETEKEEPTGEAAQPEQPVFHEVESAPVKVGETYKTVDTQAPDMDEKLAATIRQAAEDGVQRVEIKLNPANLGSITVEMTRDASGALQVVLHAATGRAENLLNQHLDGLHAALQNYGQGQQVHVEVQRGEENQEQHLFQQADPDGRGQHHQGQRQKREQEQPERGEDFLQKLRLGLVSLSEAV